MFSLLWIAQANFHVAVYSTNGYKTDVSLGTLKASMPYPKNEIK